MADLVLVARFLKHVQKTSTCWLWTGCTGEDGYGGVRFKGRTQRAHRVAYLLFVGEPGELCVLHRCDNPPCVRPSHLFLGTNADNNADMMVKGRHRGARGETHPNAKLTDAKVVEMRARRAEGGVSWRELGEEFGVSARTARAVVAMKTWKETLWRTSTS